MSLWGCGGGSGASAPAPVLLKEFGFKPKEIAALRAASGGISAPLTNPVPMIAAISPNAATRGQPESYHAAFEDESFHVAPPQRSSPFTLK